MEFFLASETPEQELAPAEKLFFGSSNLEPGEPVPDNYVDPALLTLGKGNSFGQLLLLLLVCLFSALMLSQYIDDVKYTLSDSTAIALGMTDALQNSEFFDEGHLLVESNRYVTVEGAESQVSFANETRFFKLLGAQVYVEERVEREGTRLVNALTDAPRGEESFQAYYEGGGRLIAFRDLSSRYKSLIEFYSTNYGIYFCGYDISPELERYLHNREGRVRLHLSDELGRTPTEAEFQEAMGGATSCQEAYLVLSDVTPKNQRFMLGIFGLLAVIVMGTAFRLFRLLWNFSRKQDSSEVDSK